MFTLYFENPDKINFIDMLIEQKETFKGIYDGEMAKGVDAIPENIQMALETIKDTEKHLEKFIRIEKSIREQWNIGVDRYKKAERVASEQPKIFDKYIENFNELCRGMSLLMERYEAITGQKIPDENFEEGF